MHETITSVLLWCNVSLHISLCQQSCQRAKSYVLGSFRNGYGYGDTRKQVAIFFFCRYKQNLLKNKPWILASPHTEPQPSLTILLAIVWMPIAYFHIWWFGVTQITTVERARIIEGLPCPLQLNILMKFLSHSVSSSQLSPLRCKSWVLGEMDKIFVLVQRRGCNHATMDSLLLWAQGRLTGLIKVASNKHLSRIWTIYKPKWVEQWLSNSGPFHRLVVLAVYAHKQQVLLSFLFIVQVSLPLTPFSRKNSFQLHWKRCYKSTLMNEMEKFIVQWSLGDCLVIRR